MALGAAAVYAAATARNLSMAFGYYLAGLLVAAAGGYLLADLEAVLFTAGAYLVVASAALLFAHPRSGSEIGLWGLLAAVGAALFLGATDPKTASFAIASVLILYSALKVLQVKELVHATLWLAGVLIGVAGIFLSLSAEFLAVIQLLIYVGAVITLFLFTVMLTIPSEEAHGLDALELPPGVTIESVKDLQSATPLMGAGPFKGFTETNPRKPVRQPTTLAGVHIADGVIGDETTKFRKTDKPKEGSP